MRTFGFVSSNDWEPWGGSEELWARTALTMRRDGVQVAVSVKGWPTPAPRIAELVAAGVLVQERNPASMVSRLQRKATKRALEVRQLERLPGDIVIISQGLNIDGLPWMEAARALGRPYVLVAQAASEHFWPTDDMLDGLRTGYRGAQLSAFVSQRNLELTERQIGERLPKAVVVRNPYNVSYEASPPWPIVSARGELRLASVARLDPGAKGQDLLMQVFALSKWRNRPVTLSLFGNGRSALGLARLRDIYELSNVELRGFEPDVSRIWERHHLMVLASRFEGLPLAMVEAMLCGRPVLSTDVAGANEVIEDGKNGFLASAPTVAALDEALERAWENRTALRDLGRRAAASIREVVSADPIGDFYALIRNRCA